MSKDSCLAISLLNFSLYNFCFDWNALGEANRLKIRAIDKLKRAGPVWGTYGHMLSVTDLYSGWTDEGRIYGKNAELLVSVLKILTYRLPSAMRSLFFNNQKVSVRIKSKR